MKAIKWTILLMKNNSRFYTTMWTHTLRLNMIWASSLKTFMSDPHSNLELRSRSRRSASPPCFHGSRHRWSRLFIRPSSWLKWTIRYRYSGRDCRKCLSQTGLTLLLHRSYIPLPWACFCCWMRGRCESGWAHHLIACPDRSSCANYAWCHVRDLTQSASKWCGQRFAR